MRSVAQSERSLYAYHMAAGNGNIDERLEALTMNLELMSHSVEAHDRQLATIMDAIEAHDRQMSTIMGAIGTHDRQMSTIIDAIEAHDRQMSTVMDAIEKLVNVTNEDATAIRTLARLAETHERRIADLEGGRA
jgi:chromosome segregation ATPase